MLLPPMLPPTAVSSISKAQAERTYADLHSCIVDIEDILRNAGIDVHGSSRLVTYRKRLAELERYAPDATLSLHFMESLNSILLEGDQLARSVATLAAEPEVEGWKPVAVRALGGSTSQSSSSFTPARDAQFELLVGAVARRGGSEVQFTEPDVRVDLLDHASLSIAAKRVKSASKLGRHMSQAAKQIEKSRLPGVVAVDLAFFSRKILRAPDLEAAMEELRDHNRRFIRRRLGELYKRVKTRRPLGLITFESRMAQLGELPQLATVVSVYAPTLIGLQDSRLELFKALIANMNEGCKRWLE